MTDRPFVVAGDTSVARLCVNALGVRSLPVLHLGAPSDDEIRDTLAHQPRGIAILTHNNVTSLPYALAAAHMSDAIPLVTSIFDRTIGAQLSVVLPQCHVISPAELALAPLAGPCLGAELLVAANGPHGTVEEVVSGEAGSRRRTSNRHRPPIWQLLRTRLTGLVRSPDPGTRIPLFGLMGLMSVLIADWAVLVLVLHHGVFEALQEAVSVIATVDPGTEPRAARAYALFSSAAMIATIVLTALFSVGVIDRMLCRRLVGLLGTRLPPHSNHVIVVGLGQVCVRPCRELLTLGVPVVGLERDRGAKDLRLIRAVRIPKVLGDGSDRRLLEKLRLDQARALAAVGSDELDNIAVALAVAGTAPSCRQIIRAGDMKRSPKPDRCCRWASFETSPASAPPTWSLSCLVSTPLGVVSERTGLFLDYTCGTFTPDAPRRWTTISRLTSCSIVSVADRKLPQPLDSAIESTMSAMNDTTDRAASPRNAGLN